MWACTPGTSCRVLMRIDAINTPGWGSDRDDPLTPHILSFRAFRRLAREIRDRTAYPAAKPIKYGSAFKAAVQSSSISLQHQEASSRL